MNRYRKQLLFLCDTFILTGVTVVLSAFSVRYELTDAVGQGQLFSHMLLLLGCTAVFQLLFHTYDSLWRYAESKEYLALLLAAVCGFALYEVLSRFVIRWKVISFLLLTAIASLWVLGMLVLRFVYRLYRTRVQRDRRVRQVPAAIVGAGATGVQLLDELRSNPNSRYKVECFFDDDPGKIRQRIHGVEVKGAVKDIAQWRDGLGLREVIVAMPSIGEARRQEILEELSRLEGLRVTVMPGTLELIGRKSIRSQLREMRIEDLLERKPIRLDATRVDAFLGGKTVMVVGGGGSIGSELCRQIVRHEPRKLVIIDIYENNAYDIQQELLYRYGGRLDLAVEIASIRDAGRMEQLFAKYRPEVVFHAAAHKHVPLMEVSPREAVLNNVFGTLNLVRAADQYRAEKFVLISTDKAVNPTSVMGATKRLCEMILQSMKGRSGTDFAAVRFGNVLGSNGSVVPLFQRQIRAGGPVTVTDKRMIRYFMTIPEAAQLVLQAGVMARQNELYVLDMGRPVKIVDLAEKMIRLSGLTPYRDIDIVEVGLRPGEKLYEEPLIAGRNIVSTENDQIFVEQQPPVMMEELTVKLRALSQALEADDPAAIRAVLHQIIPTFHEPEEVNGEGEDERGTRAPLRMGAGLEKDRV